jgi:small conductance mechanosensitive channel
VSRSRTALHALLLSLSIPLAAAAQGGAPPAAKTTADPKISVEDLNDLLRAPTADELVIEVEAWQKLFRDTVDAISRAHIQIRATADETAKSALREQVRVLSEQRSSLHDRLQKVILALRDKGGDVTKYQKYADAVSGITLDASDAGTATAVILSWLKSPEGGLRWGKNIAFALLTLFIFWFLAIIASGIVGAGMKRTRLRVTEGLRRFFLSTVRKTVFIMGVILALSMLEVDIGPFIAAIGVGGFVLGFALQETLGNFAAGILILMYRPFEIGNVVTAAGITGKVEDISLVSTKFLTPDNQIIYVPNGSVWGGVITNSTGNTTRRVDLTFGIGYGDDIAKAERVLHEIVGAHPKILREPEPIVKVNQLADSSVNIICRPWARTDDYWDVYWDLTRSVKERFDAEGITIPFPQREVHIRNA